MRHILDIRFPAALPVAFVNTNAGGKVYVCATPQQAVLAEGDYAALTWVEIAAVGNHGETGSQTNILNYDTWDLDVIQKGKGLTNAGDPQIEVARIPTDPGQIILRAAALTRYNYAFKVIRNDRVNDAGAPTILYNRGLVTGPMRPNGRNEDFDLERFNLALNQKEVVVDPTAGGTPPTNTVQPAITGTLEVGEVLSLSNGTFTGDATISYAYQWFAGGVAIANATNNTFLLTSAQLGKIMQARVYATNASGAAQAYTDVTAVVAP